MVDGQNPQKQVFRRQIVETVTDDLRDRQKLLIGLSEAGVISLLRVPATIAGSMFAGGVYDIKGTVLDRDTDTSPEVILVQAAKLISGAPGPEQAKGDLPSIPKMVQDAWHRTAKANLAILARLLALEPKHLGSLAAQVLRSTARSLIWISSSRTECFTTLGEEISYNLAAIANSKGHATISWLSERIVMVRDAMESVNPIGVGPESEMSVEVVNEVVRQQARIADEGGPGGGGPTGSGGKGAGTEIGHNGRRSAGNADGTGGGRGGRAPERDIIDNRIADGDLASLVDALRDENWENDPPPDESGPEYEGIPDFKPDPEELAAFNSIEANNGGTPQSGKSGANGKTNAKAKKEKKTASMANISFGSRPKRYQAGPRMR